MINLHLKVDKFIELKLPKKEDAIPVFLLIMKNRDWLGKYMEWESTTKTPQDIADFFERSEHKSYYDHSFPLIIWYKDEIVGIISYNKGNSIKKEVEIGYWISKEFSGIGIITRATKTLIKYAFSITDIKTIYICCEISNIKSYKIPQNLGFEFVEEDTESDIFYRDGKAVKITYMLKKKLS